ncbi:MULTISPECIES: helix-turn-helix domain-containing protein [Chitinophagaceae]
MRINNRLHYCIQPALRNAFLKRLLLLTAALGLGFSYCHAQGSATVQESIRQKIKEILEVAGSPSDITNAAADTLENIYNESKKQGYKQEMQDAGIALMSYYMNYGNCKKVIELGNDFKAITPLKTENTAKLHMFFGLAYGCLGFMERSYAEYRSAIQFAKETEDSDMRHYLLAIAYQNITGYFDWSNRHTDSILYYDTLGLEEAESIGDQSKTVSNALKYETIITMYYVTGLYYMYFNPQDSSIAGKYLLGALKINERWKDKISKPRQIDLYTSVSRFYLSQKKYDSAVKYGLYTLVIIENGFSSPFKRVAIYKILGEAYEEGRRNREEALKYYQLFTFLNDSLAFKEKRDGGAVAKQLVTQQDESNTQKVRQIISIAAGAVIAILFIAFLLWRRKKAALKKKYEEFIENLKAGQQKTLTTTETIADDEDAPETAQEITIDETEETEESVKEPFVVNIPDETVAALLSKLEKFERLHKYLKKDITLISLAHQFGANPRYLSEVVRRHRNKGFSHYINSLKINYITNKLYEDAIYREYKINHLAEECRFSSRQVFVLAFKKETGVTPSYFISQLKNKED